MKVFDETTFLEETFDVLIRDFFESALSGPATTI